MVGLKGLTLSLLSTHAVALQLGSQFFEFGAVRGANTTTQQLTTVASAAHTTKIHSSHQADTSAVVTTQRHGIVPASVRDPVWITYSQESTQARLRPARTGAEVTLSVEATAGPTSTDRTGVQLGSARVTDSPSWQTFDHPPSQPTVAASTHLNDHQAEQSTTALQGAQTSAVNHPRPHKPPGSGKGQGSLDPVEGPDHDKHSAENGDGESPNHGDDNSGNDGGHSDDVSDEDSDNNGDIDHVKDVNEDRNSEEVPLSASNRATHVVQGTTQTAAQSVNSDGPRLDGPPLHDVHSANTAAPTSNNVDPPSSSANPVSESNNPPANDDDPPANNSDSASNNDNSSNNPSIASGIDSSADTQGPSTSAGQESIQDINNVPVATANADPTKTTVVTSIPGFSGQPHPQPQKDDPTPPADPTSEPTSSNNPDDIQSTDQPSRPGPHSTDDEDPSDPPTSSSKAWIAAAVLLSLIGILIIYVFYRLYLRKKPAHNNSSLSIHSFDIPQFRVNRALGWLRDQYGSRGGSSTGHSENPFADCNASGMTETTRSGSAIGYGFSSTVRAAEAGANSRANAPSVTETMGSMENPFRDAASMTGSTASNRTSFSWSSW